MITLLVFAKNFYHHHNAYNTLAITTFFLLLISPFFLFSIGFQLSYLSVLGIMYLQPKIYNWVSYDNWLCDKLWKATSISVAAQFITTPISIYYFHQIPCYFIIANWMAIPFTFVILCSGLLLAICSQWVGVSSSIGWVLNWLVQFLNKFIFYLAALPGSVINDLYLARWQVVFLYAALVGLCSLILRRKGRYIVACSALIFYLLISSLQKLWRQSQQRKMICYSLKGDHATAFIAGKKSVILSDSLWNPPPVHLYASNKARRNWYGY